MSSKIKSSLPSSVFIKSITLIFFGIISLQAQISVKDDNDEGQDCFKVSTPNVTYYFQKKAGGFSSIVDKDGNDWVGYKPGGGSGGEYRGIPNLGGCCHPGYPSGGEGVPMSSTLTGNAANKVTIESKSADGKWHTRWDFYATHATLTVLKAASKYWVLYEGTPGGSWESGSDYLIFSDGSKKKGSEANFEKALSGPEWVYFGDGKIKRGLLYIQHTPDQEKDVFWSFGNMTVFGFGRCAKGTCFALSKTPNEYTIALLDENSAAPVTAFANSILKGDTPSAISDKGDRAILSQPNNGVNGRIVLDRYVNEFGIYSFSGRLLERN